MPGTSDAVSVSMTSKSSFLWNSIIAGLLACTAACEGELSISAEEELAFGSEIEGTPRNVVELDPAVLGTDVLAPSQETDVRPLADMVGIHLVLAPEQQETFVVEAEPYTLEGTLGTTLWRHAEDDADPHAQVPLVRAALAYDLSPEDIDGEIDAIVAEHSRYEELDVRRIELLIDGEQARGAGPIPGAPPSYQLYVTKGDAVHQINLYGDELSDEVMEAAAAIELDLPSVAVSSLELLDGNDPEFLYIDGANHLAEPFVDVSRDLLPEELDAVDDIGASGGAASGEWAIAEGCWKANGWFQTQHGPNANGNGWVQVGHPNYWGEYTHGNLGWGRCAAPNYTNDKFAVDYPMRRGDVLYVPFRRATVRYVGRKYTHKNYGIMVVTSRGHSGYGKYWNISAHLNGVARGIYVGRKVTHRNIIGYAGNTGHPSIPVGPVHLHSAFYRWPRNTNGAPWGGRGLMVDRMNFVRGSGGTYRFAWPSADTHATKTRWEWISN